LLAGEIAAGDRCVRRPARYARRALQRFVAEAERVLRAAGGRTKAEIEAEKVEPTAMSGIGQQVADRVRNPRGAITGSFTEGESFFKKVNALAMASLSSWVPALFPTANPYNGGYRVTSKDLWRNYQEDLSISPKGIKDWGVWDVGGSHQGKRTPIDLSCKQVTHKQQSPYGAFS
jgi:hypothetical protein